MTDQAPNPAAPEDPLWAAIRLLDDMLAFIYEHPLIPEDFEFLRDLQDMQFRFTRQAEANALSGSRADSDRFLALLSTLQRDFDLFKIELEERAARMRAEEDEEQEEEEEEGENRDQNYNGN
jgi:hypothetical protein